MPAHYSLFVVQSRQCNNDIAFDQPLRTNEIGAQILLFACNAKQGAAKAQTSTVPAEFVPPNSVKSIMCGRDANAIR
jgi:hypothetical protein